MPKSSPAKSGAKDSSIPAPPDEPNSPSGNGNISDVYFRNMGEMQEAISKRDYEKAGLLAREGLEHITGFVKETLKEYGDFGISSIPVLEQGGTMLAFLNDSEGLVRMREIVTSMSELSPWVKNVEKHERDLDLFQAITDAVRKHPNCLQTELKGLVGETDGRRVANLVSYLEKAGKISRLKEGNTYKLLLT
ncbi:MAG: hypothetical protein OXF23_03375 [Candidatus Dadabacteria bacterium]|nr:hypothetical protein [Candidatus Dadabacteria bacterium]